MSSSPYHQGVRMHIPDVETAQREYDEICARCPATHDEAHQDPKLYRLRMEWIDKKFHAKKRLDMAQAFAATGWKQDGKPVEVKIKVAGQRPQTRKPIPELITCYLDKLAVLDRVVPRSPAYFCARNQAYGYKYLLRERCNEDRVALPPDLPPVPILPPLEGPRKSPPLKPLTGDPKVDERRRKDRMRMKQRYLAGKVVNG